MYDRRMARSIATCSMVLTCATLALALSPAPSNAQNGYQRPDWLDKMLTTAKSDGLMVGYPDGYIYHYKGPSRYEDAAGLYALFINLKGLADEFEKGLSGAWVPGLGTTGHHSRRQLRSFFKRTIDWTPGLLKGARLFDSEFSAQEVDVTRFKIDIQELGLLANRLLLRVQPFPDIPKDHWAADAANNLKILDILHGYPSGTFNRS